MRGKSLYGVHAVRVWLNMRPPIFCDRAVSGGNHELGLIGSAATALVQFASASVARKYFREPKVCWLGWRESLTPFGGAAINCRRRPQSPKPCPQSEMCR